MRSNGEARVLYLAVANGRGHLMRAHLLRRSLGAAGIEVDILTTSEEGRAFLTGLGTPSRLLSDGFLVELGPRHDLDRRKTERRALGYLLRPGGALRDLLWLRAEARAYDLVVNDSLHPALLLAPLVFPRLPVVQVYGENLFTATEENFDGRAPRWVRAWYQRGLRAARDRSLARIVHSLRPAEGQSPPGTFRLPPVIARPSRDRDAVRRELGVGPEERLAAVYLNPHFRSPELAWALERALEAAGYRWYGVAEGFSGRPGWSGPRGDFGDVVHAADLFVSGAGMGALELARRAGTPMLVLLGDQPEQARNIATLRAEATRHPMGVIPLPEVRGALEHELGRAIEALSQAAPAADRAPPEDISNLHRHWVSVFERLIRRTREDRSHEANHRLGPGDAQPQRGGAARAHRGARASPAASP